MPLHDWTRVDDGRFHSFHSRWITHLTDALNAGVLPDGYYADPEQVTTGGVPDILTLREPADLFRPPTPGGIALAETPVRVRRARTYRPTPTPPTPRHVAVRHVSGDRVVAFVEIVSPANKDRLSHVEEFAAKVAGAVRHGVHVMVIDPLPPGRHAPTGMAGAVAVELGVPPVDVPSETPLAVTSYAAGPDIREYTELLSVGSPLPEMPLFLAPDRYVPVPLEPTYQLVWERSPSWRHLLGP